ncbi:2'-5' RNA ligase family protein [Phenylobacterium sp.]|uniref:2'-5' RNA ligase family protein n=1 Tax=Phenylobacterium sp. TaxID=1871053 RepID=UPI0025FDEE7B|nr:2'-5' RNA ligase family protein [Phenylobacterium sp.]
METLEVIARPHFEKADLAWLTDIRSRRAGSRGPPYFTLVFHGADLTPAAFAEQVRRLASGIPRIRFRLRSALVAPEPTVGRFHVFLIPDEGFGAILKLYDALHVGDIEAALRFDTPYLPHITVATTQDYPAARKLAQALNMGGIDIHGHIEALEVERRSGDVVKKVADVPLAKHGWFG